MTKLQKLTMLACVPCCALALLPSSFLHVHSPYILLDQCVLLIIQLVAGVWMLREHKKRAEERIKELDGLTRSVRERAREIMSTYSPQEKARAMRNIDLERIE